MITQFKIVYSKKTFQNALRLLITKCNLSFRFVKHWIFRNMIDLLRLNVVIFDWTKMTTLCYDYISQIEINILHDLSSDARYSLTLNVWINKQEQFFLTIIAYYIIEAWLYKEAFLSFKSLLYQHTEWKMINVMLKLLRQYFIKSRLLTITDDNVRSNEILRIHFSALLSEHCNFVWNSQKNIIRCMIHVMQLMLSVSRSRANHSVRWSESRNALSIKRISKRE
jgi:hypothetical protein